MNKRAVIGVLGSGQNEWEEWSVPLGRWIAENGFHLLTGGGKGVMEAVARGFHSVEKREGLSIGVVPTEECEERGYVACKGYPNAWVELPLVSPLPAFYGTDDDQVSRNHIVVLTADILIALPGSKGTRNEISLATKFKKPILLLGPRDAMPTLPGEESAEDLVTAYEFALGSLGSRS